MGIFCRRRLCLLCCLFCLSSVAAWFCSSSLLIKIGVALLCFLLPLSALFWKLSCYRRRLLTVILCLVFVFTAFLHTLLWIALPQENAERYTGERVIQARIIERQYQSEYSAQYLVRLEGVDEEAVGINALWSCPFGQELSAGDTVYARARVESYERDSDGAVLFITSESTETTYVRHTSNEPILTTLRSVGGLRILSNRVRDMLRGWLSSQLGEEVGALSGAFLFGDSSALSLRVIRDFQRAGVSHMMAVSGLHIAILLGSAELVLRRLYMPKILRCVTIALLGMIFLFLTGFSLSACRSVLMLFCVYLFFFLREGNDALTALFASIALILLISPHAVGDLGMWMSFLATLGLLTLYPLCEKAIPYSCKKGMLGRALRMSRRVLLLILMTVIANLFLLPVIWIFFGEISLIALIANPVLSPIAYVFLLAIPLFMMTFFIPWIGAVMRGALLLLSNGMLAIVSKFSHMPYATVSLRYGFCYVLIPLFAVSMTVLLIVRLRRRRWLILPGALSILAFAVCLGITHTIDRPATLTVISDFSENDMIAVTQTDQFSLCDASGGSVSAMRRVWNQYQSSTATEIETLLLTHYHERHLTGLDWLMQRTVIRRLYLPVPWNEESRVLAAKLYVLATELYTEVIFYSSNDSITLTDGVSLFVRLHTQEGEHPHVWMTFCGSESAVTYLSPSLTPTFAQMRTSDTLIFGSHGTISPSSVPIAIPEDCRIHTVIDLHPSSPAHTVFFERGMNVYIPKKEQEASSIFLPIP